MNGKDALRTPDLNVARARGMVNSHSRTNGLAPRSGYLNTLPLRRNPLGIVTHSDLRRSGALLAASLAVMLVFGYLLGTPVPTLSPFGVDGDFSEWSGVPLYDDPADVAPGEIDLLAYGVHETLDQVFVYGRTRAPLFPSTNATSVYLVVDSSTVLGYQAPGIEADYLAEVWGWDNAVHDTMLREWTGGSDRDNATSFLAVGRFPAVAVGNEFELAIRDDALTADAIADVRMVLAARSDDIVDLGATVGVIPGSLLVGQRPLTNLSTAPGPLVELRFRALASDVRVDAIAVQQSGGGVVGLPSLPFTVAAGTERVETLVFDPGAEPPGSFITVKVAGVTAGVPGGSRPIPVTISGDDTRFYVQGRPGGIVVDGLFDDWVNVTADPTDSVPSTIDILESATSFPSSAFFYLQTEARILSGAFLPEHRERAVQAVGNASGAPVPPRRVAGEDVLRIYVDTNSQDAVGVPFNGLFVDRYVEVRGRIGRVTSTSLFAWNATAASWEERTDPFNVVFVGSRLEASAAASFFGAVPDPRVLFEMSDWSNRGDLSALLGPAGALLAPTSPTPEHGIVPDRIEAPPLTNTPTVDGRCPTTAGEYAGAATGITFGFTFSIGRRDDTEHVYICIDTDDLTGDFNDFSEIVFDTKHDGGAAPQPDDRLFWIFTNDNVIGMAEGDGFGWVICGSACDPSNAAEGRFRGGAVGEQYEYKIRYTDIWGTLQPQDEVAGFAVFVWDDGLGRAYGWGSNFLNDSVPDTWGHLAIPEFPIDGLPVAGLVAGTTLVPLVIIRRARGRQRRSQGSS